MGREDGVRVAGESRLETRRMDVAMHQEAGRVG